MASKAFQALARSKSQLADGNSIGEEPSDGFALIGFEDTGRPGKRAAEEGGRYPMLAFVRDDMIDHIKKPIDGYLESVLFADFTDERSGETFSELDASSGEFPFVPFVAGLGAAFGEKEPSLIVHDNGTCSDTDVIDPSAHGA